MKSLAILLTVLLGYAGLLNQEAFAGGALFRAQRTTSFPNTRATTSSYSLLQFTNYDDSIPLHVKLGKPRTPFFKLIGQDSLTVLPRATGSFTFLFSPTDSGSYLDSIHYVTDGYTDRTDTSELYLNGYGKLVNDTGALFRVTSDYVLFPTVRATKFVNDTILFSNLDSFYSLHIRIPRPSNSAFSIIGKDSIGLGPLGAGVIVFRFSPSDSGHYQEDLHYTSDGVDLHRSLLLQLNGNAFSANDTAPRIQVYLPSPTITTDSSATIYLTITNHVDTLRDLYGSVGLPTNPAIHFIGTDTTFRLPENGTATLPFLFSSQVPGTFRDSLFIRSNANTPLTKVYFNGIVLAPIISSLSDSSLDFGNVAVNGDSSIDILYSNTSASDVLLRASYTLSHAPFFVTPSINGSDLLLKGDARTLSVDFKPIATGSFSDSLVITSNATKTQRRRVVMLRGTAFVSSVSTLSQPGMTLSISPNPARNVVIAHITSLSEDVVKLELINELGERVFVLPTLRLSTGDNDVSLPATSLVPGAYRIRISGNRTITGSFVIQ